MGGCGEEVDSMGQFTLKTTKSDGMTGVSNLFLDYYMPGANGEYVKIYLYLLRALSNPPDELSVAGLADALECTEGDILRALKYWEKQGILSLECDASNTLQGIYLCPVPKPPSSDAKIPDEQAKDAPQNTGVSKKSYSRNELERFSKQAEVQQLMFACEQYMKKPLSGSEVETIFYFYDQLHFSADLIDYLVEYCVCKGSRSIHYIKTVALAWAEAGITTVAQAKERTTTYRRNTFAIMKAFGINDRNPVESEMAYIEKWLGSYGFTLDLVLEACKRTMERHHKPIFEYADKILQKWADKKVHTIEDIRKLDMEHQRKKAQSNPASAARSTGFTNFEQREYDFDELEKLLLQNQD